MDCHSVAFEKLQKCTLSLCMLTISALNLLGKFCPFKNKCSNLQSLRIIVLKKSKETMVGTHTCRYSSGNINP